MLFNSLLNLPLESAYSRIEMEKIEEIKDQLYELESAYSRIEISGGKNFLVKGNKVRISL